MLVTGELSPPPLYIPSCFTHYLSPPRYTGNRGSCLSPYLHTYVSPSTNYLNHLTYYYTLLPTSLYLPSLGMLITGGITIAAGIYPGNFSGLSVSGGMNITTKGLSVTTIYGIIGMLMHVLFMFICFCYFNLPYLYPSLLPSLSPFLTNKRTHTLFSPSSSASLLPQPPRRPHRT